MQPRELTTRLLFLITMETPCRSWWASRDHSTRGNGRFYHGVDGSVHNTTDRLSRWHKLCKSIWYNMDMKEKHKDPVVNT